MPTLYTARTVDGLVIRTESLTATVAALADADGIDQHMISTRQVRRDQWHVYESPDALDSDPDGIHWFARITVDSGDYGRLFFGA